MGYFKLKPLEGLDLSNAKIVVEVRGYGYIPGSYITTSDRSIRVFDQDNECVAEFSPMIPWASFAPDLGAVVSTEDAEREAEEQAQQQAMKQVRLQTLANNLYKEQNKDDY